MGAVDTSRAFEADSGVLLNDGSGLFSGEGDPSGTAPLGTLYIDVLNGKIWKYISTGWTLQLADAASPGFSYGRGGNNPTGTFLNRPGNVPSNVAGIVAGLDSPKITQITVGSGNAATWEVGIYEHDGGGDNLTFIDSVSVVASKSETFSTDISITKGKHIAVRVYTGSVQNPGVDLQIAGSVS